MSDSMIERVARAICLADRYNPDESWPVYEKQARAAIAAMREPTTSMSEAGCPLPDNSGAPYCYDQSVIDGAWRAMIDAALKEP